LAVRPSFSEADLAIRHKNDFPSSRRRNHLDVGAVVAECASDLDMAHGLHPLQRVDQSLVLSFLVRLNQNCFVRRSRELIDIQCHANIRPQLCARTEGRGVNGLVFISREAGKACYQQQTTQ